MTRIPASSRLLAPVLLAASLLLVVSARPAEAHSTVAVTHEPAADGAALESGHGVNSSLVAGWSRSCPGGSGNSCCCCGTTACTVVSKLPIATAGGWGVLAAPLIRRLYEFDRSTPSSRLRSLPPLPPRGPPLHS